MPWHRLLFSLVGLAAAVSGCGSDGAISREPSFAVKLVRPQTSGELVAYTRNVDGHTEVYVARSDGRRPRRLTRSRVQANASGNSNPAWSPSGRRLAFIATRNRRIPEPPYEEQFFALFTVRQDGLRRRQLIPYTSDFLDNPAWSPDGRLIAFDRFSFGDRTRDVEGDETSVIAVIGANGGKERQLAGSKKDSEPAWSPDGRWLAFTRGSEGDQVEIWRMRPDGSNAGRITTRGGGATWSPDGNRIAFSSARDRYGTTVYDDGASPNSEVYVMSASGTRQKRLTHNRADDHSPTWSPNGRSIIFDSSRGSDENFDHHLWMMRADGRCVRRLLRDPQWTLEAAWQPGPARRHPPLPPC